ncbi:MAG: DoxX family membrane protein [Elusimicrobia bacterium]|nr:DoxX family membrane protein [Elusimicrobiota bacterium]
MSRRGIFWTLLRIAVGAVFLAASLYKLKSPDAFAHEIFHYQILPSWAVNAFALVLPWLEFLVGAALVAGRFDLGAAALSVLLMAMFQSALASALARHLSVTCGCFKPGGDPATWKIFGRDGLIFIAAIANAWQTFRAQED